MTTISRCALSGLWLALIGCKADLDVGASCEPQHVPCTADGTSCGYTPAMRAVENDSPSCDQTCVVDRLDNGTNGQILADPVGRLCSADDTQPGCVTQSALTKAVYCSCPCLGPKSAGPFCTCPDDFSCTQFEGASPEGIAYCVRRAQ